MSRSKTVDRVKLLDEDGFRMKIRTCMRHKICDYEALNSLGQYLRNFNIAETNLICIINITTKRSDVMQNYSPSQDNDNNFGWKIW